MCRQSREEEGGCENLPRLIAKSAGKEITVRHSWLQQKRYESKPQIWKEKNKTNNEPRKTSCDSNNNIEATTMRQQDDQMKWKIRCQNRNTLGTPDRRQADEEE